MSDDVRSILATILYSSQTSYYSISVIAYGVVYIKSKKSHYILKCLNFVYTQSRIGLHYCYAPILKKSELGLGLGYQQFKSYSISNRNKYN
jgi:hypothetical protein